MRRLALVVAAVVFFATSAFAAPITFIGSDNGATSLATAPNSVAAANAFDAAASLLGPMGLITFETAPLGPIANTPLGGGVSVDGSGFSISNDAGPSADTFGFNTTPGGQYFATSFPSCCTFNLEFSFADPIQAFGAYLGGLQGDLVGQQTLVYTDGSTFTINIPMLSGGTAFVGFTDAGASILSVRYSFINDYVTVDDVRYGPTSAAVPEPASLLLLGAGIAGLLARRRRAAAE